MPTDRRPARLCLKARPVDNQLTDRLRPVDGAFPDGLELYLDVADIADDDALHRSAARVERHLAGLPDSVRETFALLIEGPVGSLDGQFFDVTRAGDADTTVVDRLAWMARRLHARAVNIHLIAPSDDLDRLTLAAHDDLMGRALPFLRHFADVTCQAGALPTIENMPPVLRMRQGGSFFTPIGMAGADLLYAVDAVPNLRLLPDTSHAGLYLNARAAAEGRAAVPADAAGSRWAPPLFAYLRALPPDPPDLLGYFRSLAPHVANAQVSNATGILGEGVRYAEGDFDLDPVIRWLAGPGAAEHIVTETLEPDPADARTMREALRAMRAALAAA